MMSFAQNKIDTDSLLQKTLTEMRQGKNPEKAIKMAQLGIKVSPDYLDFHLALGRFYQSTEKEDSARYYYRHVISKNTKYKEAFLYLIPLELHENQTTEARKVLTQAVSLYAHDKDFENLELQVLYQEEDDTATLAFLDEMVSKYPTESKWQQERTQFKTKLASNRIGLSTAVTFFSRENVGPWTFNSLQYVRERKRFTGIARINYASRYSNGILLIDGMQYEAEAYLKHGQKDYSYANIGFSNALIFPKIRSSYSYFHNFSKGWETETGVRFTHTTDQNLGTAVLGLSKYVGSYWLNLRTYTQFQDKKIYPAFLGTARYYWNTKYDYATAFLGYGTSPDERSTQSVLTQQASLSSYRFGLGYSKLFKNHYIASILGAYTYQEFKPSNFQNEYQLYLSLQYKW